MLFTSQGLASGGIQDLGHSFSQYGPTSRYYSLARVVSEWSVLFHNYQ